jgi:hypothetical protein
MAGKDDKKKPDEIKPKQPEEFPPLDREPREFPYREKQQPGVNMPKKSGK